MRAWVLLWRLRSAGFNNQTHEGPSRHNPHTPSSLGSSTNPNSCGMKHLAATAALCTSSIDARREKTKKSKRGAISRLTSSRRLRLITSEDGVAVTTTTTKKKLLTRSHLQLSLRATWQTLQVFIEIGNQLSCVPMPPNHFEIGMSKRGKKNKKRKREGVWATASWL